MIHNKKVAIALGVLLALAEVLQQSVLEANETVHTILGLVIAIIAGFGIVPAAPESIVKLIPLPVAAGLTSLIGVLNVVQQNELVVSQTVKDIISFVLLIAIAVGLSPSRAPKRATTIETGQALVS